MAATQEHSVERALDLEVVRMEVAVVGVATMLAGVLLAVAIHTTLFIHEGLGTSLMIFSTLAMTYFTVVHALLRRGRGVAVFPWLNPLVEISLPSVLILLDVHHRGAEYAALSALPVQLYGIITTASALRLKRIVPMAIGIVGAVQYVLIHLVVIRPRLGAVPADSVYRLDLILMRALIIILAGATGMLLGKALRSAVGAASREWRSQQLFGKYRLGPMIANGGMGTVHRATYCPEGGFERPVALKRIHPHLAHQDALVTSFRGEAQISSRLTHPNIVQVLDFGRVEDTYFLAMEFVDGLTLLDVVRRLQRARRDVPAGIVAFVARELCAGLGFAHGTARDGEGKLMRVIHRDLSHSNVMVTWTGQVKVMDFGIARALGESRSHMTTSLAGKVSYMAPEQVEGQPLDERCDLFAVGIMVWELLTLRGLFHRDSEAATLMAVISGEIHPPSLLRTDLRHPAGWDALIKRALARPLHERFQSAEEMEMELNELWVAEGRPSVDELRAFMQEVGALDQPPEPGEDATQLTPRARGAA